MNRRRFLFTVGGAAASATPAILAAVSADIHVAPRRRLRVCVIGFPGRAISAVDSIRWTAPLWLDGERFSLSVLLVWDKTWDPRGRMVGAFGEVPASVVRAWGDLRWLADDLSEVDLVIALVDLWADSRAPAAAEVICKSARFVPRVAALALVPWEVVGGKLVPDPDPGVRQAIARIGPVCQLLQLIPGNGVPHARIRLAEVAEVWPHTRTLEELEKLVPWEDSNRSVKWSETDQLASPVIRMLAKASRAHFLPSTVWRG